MRTRLTVFTAALLFLGTRFASAQTRIINGTVTDSATSEAVTSGQVSVQGLVIAIGIKSDGTFSITVPDRAVVLLVRSIGFKSKALDVPATENTVRFRLAKDNFRLEAVVVSGQATAVERKNIANSVATVSADQLVAAPTASVETALQGKFAGADIGQNNGAPGGGNIVRMRGVTSVIGTFQPLYVVDGVIVSNAEIGRGTNLLTRANTTQGIVPTVDNQDNAINRIADINPNDIENVEVLKGASASAIYGSKAANGVILISTKRGRSGAPQFTVLQRFGASSLSNKYGTRCFKSAEEAQGVFGGNAGDQWTAAKGACHDFEDELYGGAAPSWETSGSMSGGNDNSKYFASLLLKHEDGIMPRTYADKHGLRLGLDQNIGSKVILSLGGDILHNANDRGLSNNENNGSPPQAAYSSMPSFIDYRGVCPNGSRVTDPANPCAGATFPSTAPYAFSNPFQTVALLVNKEIVWREIMTGHLDYNMLTTPRNTLRFSANGGGDIFTQKNSVYSPPEMQFEQTRGIPGTSATGFGQSQSFNINGNVVYTYNTGGGSTATTQGGIQYETGDFDRNNTLANNLVGGQFNVQSGTVIAVQQYREHARSLGFFAQEEFLTMNERLMLTLGGRADKSSNNSHSDKVYYYPKASVSYRVPISGFFSELKVRAAAGQSGNLPTYGQKFTELRPANINGLAISSIATVVADTGVRPERQTEYEAGVDATLWSGRANLELTGYQKQIKDLLLTKTLVPTAGFAQLVYNGPEIRNRGLEVAVNVFPVQTPRFAWNSRVMFFRNYCAVMSGLPNAFQPISFFNFAQFATTELQDGKSCTQVTANDTLGRLGPNDTIRPDGTQGEIGEVVSRKIGENSPTWRGSLGNDLSYRKVKLSFLLERQSGGLITNFSRFTYDAVGTSKDEVVAQSGLPTGKERVSSNAAYGSATWDASYWKLREATLSYEVPASVVHRYWGGSRYLRLNVTGRNLYTWSKYLKIGYDPEVQQVARSLAAESTWELWAYPPSRSFYFTIDLGF
ncbi:MAG TPA: SusC/RagA family TonB-linked outer membrane protein [Gemmatimonadaceae bacterium]|nr:SusC/RagA family TonB-linked outer membrane protein [Gemmatimonadaceae bacterium]